MTRIARVLFLACVFATANAQEKSDCSVGAFTIGGPAPQHGAITSVPSWFKIKGAHHYRIDGVNDDDPHKEIFAVKDGVIIAVIRQFTVDRTDGVLDALTKRYGPSEAPRGPWVNWKGDCSEQKHRTWTDKACGLRIDAFPSIDPSDWRDERTVVVWTQGANGPAVPDDAAIR